MADRKSSYEEFWPFYLQQHARPETRGLHYIGTSIVVGLALLVVASRRWKMAAAMPLAGYFFAWMAHFFFEKNRPATFTHPLWSLRSDFRMYRLFLTRRLGAELEAAGVGVRA